MKKILFAFILLFNCQFASADLILLKNGEIIEAEIIQVRDIFIRIVGNYDSPFREFLIEDIINIEQSSPNEISQLAIRNIHQRALNRANTGKIQEAVDKKASEMLHEAIQSSEVITYEKASDEVRSVAQEKASVIIGEAVINAKTPRLDEVSADVKTVAEEKASSVIEQAVKILEVFPLQSAPDGVQIAAKQAAAVLVGEAVEDAREKRSAIDVKDLIIGILALSLLLLLFQVKRKNRKESKDDSNQALKSSLKEIDEELKKFDQTLEKDEDSEGQETQWTEKRAHKRVQWSFPVALSLDELNPIFAMVKDISLGGAFAVCNDTSLLRTLGDRSQFKFNLSSKDPNFPIHGKAEVVRIRSNRGLGLKFFDLDQNSISYLQSVA